MNKIIKNISWLFFDKFLKIFGNLFVGVLIARKLGAEDFGFFNYMNSILIILSIFSSLGLHNIAIKLIITSEDEKNLVLGNCFLLQIFSGFLAFFLSVIFLYKSSLSPEYFLIGSIFCFSLVFSFSNVPAIYFESQLNSKYIVICQNSIFLFFAAVKIYSIWNNESLYYLAITCLVESILYTALIYYVFFIFNNKIVKFKYSFDGAVFLLKKSWPLLVSGFAAALYTKIDQLFLVKFIGTSAAGIYSAASRIVEITYILPVAISASIFPILYKINESDKESYERRISNLFDFLVVSGVLLSITVTIFSEHIIFFIYGAEFLQSKEVLVILIWSSTFVFLGIASSRWYIAEGLMWITLKRALFTCILNVALLFMLIPSWGVKGAAYSALISQIFSCFIFDLLDRSTWKILKIKFSAIYIFGSFQRTYKMTKDFGCHIRKGLN